MSHTTKFVLILAVICLGLGMGLVGLTQENTVAEEVKLDEEVEAKDLEVEQPRLLPDSPFYFLKEWGRGIQSFFAFGRLRKLELETKFANERLIELKKLVEEGKIDSKVLEKATEKYEKALERIQTRAEKIKEKAAENEEVNKFLDKFIKHQLLHQRVLQKLEEQVPQEVFQKIKEAREKHLERFGQVMTKLENRMEELQERIEKQIEEIKGSEFKNFKNLEFLKELEEKIPEQAKETIRKAQENVLKRLQENLEEMSSENQERFKEYIDKISGDKEKQLQIFENLKIRIEKPIACITLWDPVCGKDGKTYSNSCFANLAGIEVDYQGECSE